MKKYILILAAIVFATQFFSCVEADSNHAPYKKTLDYPKLSGPEHFLKYHTDIKTNEGEDAPGYEAGYISEEYAALRARSKNYKKAPLDWKERGPGNVGGRTRGIWIDPDDVSGKTVFAGAVGGGMWKTDDAGNSWENLTNELPILSVSTVVGSQANTDVLYMGTGEGFGRLGNIQGTGIWRSDNKGQDWRQLEITKGIPTIYDILVNSEDENEFVFSHRSDFRSGREFQSAIFRTRDGGESIEVVYQTDRAIEQLVQHPNSFDTLYATVNGKGMVWSTNGGTTWATKYVNNDVGRMALAVSPVNPEKLFINAEKGGQGEILHAGTIGSSRIPFFPVIPSKESLSFGDWFSGQGWYDNTIVAHPYDENKFLFAGAGPIIEAEIVGFDSLENTYLADFSILVDGYYEYRDDFPNSIRKGVHVDHHTLKILPQQDGNYNIYEANDGGVAISLDAGQTFLQTGSLMAPDFIPHPTIPDSFEQVINPTSKGYNTSQFYGIDKMNGADRYVGGTQDNGSWISPANSDEESDWQTTPGGDGFEAVWHYNNPDLIIETSQFNNFYKSTDRGATWKQLIVGGGSGPFITNIGGSQQNPDQIFSSSSQGVLKSLDFGESWETIPVPNSWGYSSTRTMVRTSLASPAVIWTGTGMDSGRNILVSEDGGNTFNNTVNYRSATLGTISGMTTDPIDSKVAYILFSQSNGPKILKTTDLGRSYTDISGFVTNRNTSRNGFPDVATYSLLVMPYDTNIIWAGTEIGIVESTDGGETWHLSDSGLPAVAVWDMKIVNDEVVVGTHGRGVWSVSLPELAGYEPIKVPLLNNDNLAFDGLIKGEYSIPEDIDSSVINFTYEANGKSIEERIAIEGNQNPTTNTFQLQLTELPDEEFAKASAVINSYKNGEVISNISTSNLFIFKVFEEPIEEGYINNFEEDLNDFARLNMGYSKPNNFESKGLNSPHPVQSLSRYISVFQYPIKVSDETFKFSYDEVALIEQGTPGVEFPQFEYWDYALIEGTKDRGITWDTLEAYDARLIAEWDDFLSINGCESDPSLDRPGQDLIFKHIIDLSETYNNDDEVYLKFTLVTDPCANGWGWFIDNFAVGDETVNTENTIIQTDLEIRVVENPISDQLRMEFKSNASKQIGLQFLSQDGKALAPLENIKLSNGVTNKSWDWSQYPAGIYFARIQKEGVVETIRIVKV